MIVSREIGAIRDRVPLAQYFSSISRMLSIWRDEEKKLLFLLSERVTFN